MSKKINLDKAIQKYYNSHSQKPQINPNKSILLQLSSLKIKIPKTLLKKLNSNHFNSLPSKQDQLNFFQQNYPFDIFSKDINTETEVNELLEQNYCDLEFCFLLKYLLLRYKFYCLLEGKENKFEDCLQFVDLFDLFDTSEIVACENVNLDNESRDINLDKIDNLDKTSEILNSCKKLAELFSIPLDIVLDSAKSVSIDKLLKCYLKSLHLNISRDKIKEYLFERGILYNSNNPNHNIRYKIESYLKTGKITKDLIFSKEFEFRLLGRNKDYEQALKILQTIETNQKELSLLLFPDLENKEEKTEIYLCLFDTTVSCYKYDLCLFDEFLKGESELGGMLDELFYCFEEFMSHDLLLDEFVYSYYDKGNKLDCIKDCIKEEEKSSNDLVDTLINMLGLQRNDAVSLLERYEGDIQGILSDYFGE